MSLSRIVLWLLALVICGVVLSVVLNVLKAILIVGIVALAIGVGLGLSRSRRKPNLPRIER
jgi:hypothetical protein